MSPESGPFPTDIGLNVRVTVDIERHQARAGHRIDRVDIAIEHPRGVAHTRQIHWAASHVHGAQARVCHQAT